MAENSETGISADVLDDVTVTSNEILGTASEDQLSLLTERGVVSRLPSIRVLFLCVLALVAAGGVGVGTWLLIGTTGGGGSDTPFHLVNRSSWGARTSNGTTPFPHPPPTHVVIIHTETATCDSEAVCSAVVREIQQQHMNRSHFSDIGYNFLVGGDGQTYEGAAGTRKGLLQGASTTGPLA